MRTKRQLADRVEVWPIHEIIPYGRNQRTHGSGFGSFAKRDRSPRIGVCRMATRTSRCAMKRASGPL